MKEPCADTLISPACISHHYAALCKLQLIHAYYPQTKSTSLISSCLAAAQKHAALQWRPIWQNPHCYKDSNHPGLINFKQAGTIRSEKQQEHLHPGACTIKSQHEMMKGQRSSPGLQGGGRNQRRAGQELAPSCGPAIPNQKDQRTPTLLNYLGSPVLQMTLWSRFLGRLPIS